MGPRVFFSYSLSADQAIADKLVGEIERRGVPCWISSRDVRFGEDYQVCDRRRFAREWRGAAVVFGKRQQVAGKFARELSLASKYKEDLGHSRAQVCRTSCRAIHFSIR